MFLVHSVFIVKYLKIRLGCIYSVVAHRYGVRKSICTCIYLFSALTQNVFIAKIQIHIAKKFFRLFKHFEHFFTVDADGNPHFLVNAT